MLWLNCSFGVNMKGLQGNGLNYCLAILRQSLFVCYGQTILLLFFKSTCVWISLVWSRFCDELTKFVRKEAKKCLFLGT